MVQENQEEEQDTKRVANRSHSARRSRAAAVHNQSERVTIWSLRHGCYLEVCSILEKFYCRSGSI